MALTKQDRRQRIRNRIRKIVSGTANSPDYLCIEAIKRYMLN